jgi:hypothetical protein
MRCPAHTTNLSATPGRPACPSRASGWSSLTTPWGFPCFVRFPCVHAAATTPAQRLNVSLRSYRVDLHIVLFEDCSAFTRVAACTLALSPIRDTLIEGFSHFVTSVTAPIASGWSDCRVGLAPTGKRRLCTAHTLNGHRPSCLDLHDHTTVDLVVAHAAEDAIDVFQSLGRVMDFYLAVAGKLQALGEIESRSHDRSPNGLAH